MLEEPKIKKVDKRDKQLPQNFEQLIEMYDVEKIWPYILKTVKEVNINSETIEKSSETLNGEINKINNKFADSLPNWIRKNSNLNKTIVIEGDANTYYPVQIQVQTNKEMPQTISIYKNLGSQTADYPYNHTNGTSSLWLLYECRSKIWDGNGGFIKTKYKYQGYATLVSHTELTGGASGDLVVWLRGGGTFYAISSDNTIVVNVHYSNTNIGSADYPIYVAPRTDIGNGGIHTDTYLGYGDISGNASYATSAGSATNANYATNAGTATNANYAMSAGSATNANELNPSNNNYNRGSWNVPTRGLITQVTDNSGAQHSALVGLKSDGATRNYGIDLYDSDTSPAMRLYAGNGFLSVESDGSAWCNGLLRSQSNGNTVSIGSQNNSWCHIYNSADRPFYFNNEIFVNGYNLAKIMAANITENTAGNKSYVQLGFLKLCWGKVNITPVANTPTSAYVTFPLTYTKSPSVFTNADSKAPGSKVHGNSAASITTSGFEAYVYRTDTTTTSIMWFAIGE